jgi:hypothetical protein
LPYKDKDKRAQHAKEYGAEWYQRNREKTLERTKKRKKEQRDKFQEYKAGLACFFCGIQHPAVIDFHHPDASGDKKVSELLQRGSIKKAYEEAEKCIPLCANCHRIYHWTEREGEKDE